MSRREKREQEEREEKERKKKEKEAKKKKNTSKKRSSNQKKTTEKNVENKRKTKNEKEIEEIEIPTQTKEKRKDNTKNKRKKKKKKDNLFIKVLKTILKILLIIILIIILILGCFVGWLGFKYDWNLNNMLRGGAKQVALFVTGQTEEDVANLDPLYCLVLGVSTDEGLLLTDTIILCAYYPRTQEASMLSIPRDTFVGRSESTAGGYDKIKDRKSVV